MTTLPYTAPRHAAQRHDAPIDRPAPSPQRLARITGILYLIVAVFGMFSPLVLESLVVPGDAAATGYLTDGLANVFVTGYGGLTSMILLTPALLGELGLTAWLLAKSISLPQSRAAWGS